MRKLLFISLVSFSCFGQSLTSSGGIQTSISAPTGSCIVGASIQLIPTTGNQYYCAGSGGFGSTGTWTISPTGGGGGAVSSVFGRSGSVIATSGDYTAAQVTNAAATNASNTFTAGTQDFSGVTHTLPVVTGITSSKPATCTVGEVYFATDATPGSNWFLCTATNIWSAQLAGSSTVTGRSTSQSSTSIVSSTNVAPYTIKYYADLSTAGSGCTVSFTFNWTDASAARTLTTGNLTLSTQSSGGYISGEIPIRTASASSITYTSTVGGTCGSGTYDIMAWAVTQ